MARRPVPSFYASLGFWCCTIQGKRRKLATPEEGEEIAWRRFHVLMAQAQVDENRPSGITAVSLLEAFLDHVKRNHATTTLQTYREQLNSFSNHIGNKILATEIKPFHVSGWIASRQWAPATQCGAVGTVKTAFIWATREGYLEKNPLQYLKRPTPTRRLRIMSHEQIDRIFSECRNKKFLDLLTVLGETGCRPSEAYSITAEMVDLTRGVVIMESKTSKRTGRKRVIYLSDRVKEILVPLMTVWKKGPLLRNRDGMPWSRHVVARRFQLLRKKLGGGKEMTAESFRHVFATDALEKGVDITTVATLMGHTNANMVAKIYGHLEQRTNHLQNALEKIRPGT